MGRDVELAALRDEVRRTRIELAETVEVLATRLDVKARLRESADQARDRMRLRAAGLTARLQGRSGPILATRPAVRLPVAETWLAIAAGAVTVAVVLLVRGRNR